MIQRMVQEQAENAHWERLLRLQCAWDAYEGNLPKPLKVEKGQPDDNILLAFGQVVVNKGVSFLFPEGISFEVDGQAKSDADTWLQECWDANGMMTTLLKVGINGGVCGDVFIRVKPRKPYPRIIVLDPSNVDVILDEDDCDTVLSYVLQWNVHGKDLVKRTTISRESDNATFWTITDEESRDGGKFVQTNTEVWPYDWAPIFHCQNLPCPNSFWGYSDLEAAVIAINKALNFNATNTARILRFYAHPTTVFKGLSSPPQVPGARIGGGGGNSAAATGLDMSVGGIIKLANPQADAFNLEMKSDLGSSLADYDKLKSALHEITRIPEVATGKVQDLGQLSGLALQILYQPLLEKTRDKRTLYGEMLEFLGRCLLQMNTAGAKHTVKTKWPPVLPSDRKGDVETAVLEVGLGVSKDTALTKLGYNSEDEGKKKAKETQAAEENARRMMKNFDAGRNGPLDNNAPAQ